MPRERNKPKPNVLAIAGSDSGGCAGIQADLKTFAAFGVHGLSVVTGVTAQNSARVTAIHRVPSDYVTAQLAAIFSDFDIAAIKIGMLASAATLDAVVDVLKGRRARNVVVDPVLVSSSGAALFPPRALGRLRNELFPLTDLLTPNVPEAETILGRRIARVEDLPHAARDLLGTGARAVLLKGGHLRGDAVHDVLVDARSTWHFTHERRPGSVRGTGCTLSSAIACGLAEAMALHRATARAEAYLQAGMQAAYRPGRSSRLALDHSAHGKSTRR
jgi:hydroxymethylpyrimidine/phosphomethylpyrimidine kinase